MLGKGITSKRVTFMVRYFLIPLEELLKKQETFLTPTLYIVLGDKNDKRQANSSKIKSIIKGAE